MSAVLPLGAMPSPWRQALPAFALGVVAVLLLYHATFAGMVGIWARSDTFAHAFLVAPISIWLAWRRRDVLREINPRPQLAMLLPAALVGLGWLVGDLAGINALTQLAATTLLVLTVPALLGPQVARALAFPLTFLFFMVPVGEFVMPLFMQWTADVTVFSLKLVGIPVYREGLRFVIPSGTWSIVEACSGVRYLIASFMVGTLFAYLNYQSTRRRLIFCVVSLAVPVVANWMRAFIIVMLGHLSGNRIAAGVDHLIYGWLFFGIVIGAMFFIGARWSEPATQPGASPAPPQADGTASAEASILPWRALVLLALACALAPFAAWRIGEVAVAPPVLSLPDLPGRVSDPALAPLHRPHFEGAAAEASRVYGSGAAAVSVDIAYYRQQTYGRKLASSENVLVKSNDTHWRIVAQGERRLEVEGRSLAVRSAELRSGSLAEFDNGATLQVRQILWVGGHLTTSDHLAAAWGVFGQLSGRGDDAAAITFYSSAGDAALDRFVVEQLPHLASWLDAVGRQR